MIIPLELGGANHGIFKTATTEDMYVWLDVVNDSNNFNELCVGFSDLATDGYDIRLDSYKADGEAAISLATTLNGEKFCIQTIAQMEEFDVRVLDVTINTKNDGTHTFYAPRFENVPDQLEIYLFDNITNTKTDLKASDYSVYLPSGDLDNRFQLIFEMGRDPLISGIENVDLSESVDVFQSGKNLVVSTHGQELHGVEIFNVSGQLMLSTVGANSFSIESLNKGFYIVKVTLKNGNVVAEKKVLN